VSWLSVAAFAAEATPRLDPETSPATKQTFDFVEEPIFLDTVSPNRIVLRKFQHETERGPFIGVSASPVPAVLRDQLQLKPGIGLVVDFVSPEGPAAKAGLRKSDVVDKFDDQLLVNPQQLAVLVRHRKPGDTITFSVIRAAKPLKVEVTVAEGDVPPIDDVISQDGVLKFKNLLKPTPVVPGYKVRSSGGGAGGDFDPFGPRSRDTAFELNSSDKEHRFNVTQDAGGRRLIVRDKSGKQIFDGPINTDEEVEKLPAEIREKVKKLQAKWKQLPATAPGAEPPVDGA
jgi:hypothetical protein